MNMLSPLESLLLFLFKTLDGSEEFKIEGRTKLQKIVYLSSRPDNIFNLRFVGYHYGPYSRELQEAISKMLAFNLIREEEEGFNHNTRYNYKLTSEGIEQARNIWDALDQKSKERIDRLATTGKKINLNPLSEVLTQAYATAKCEGIL